MLECDKKEQNHSIAADLIEMILNHLNLDKEAQSLFIQTVSPGSKEPGETVGAGVYFPDLGISIGTQILCETSIFFSKTLSHISSHAPGLRLRKQYYYIFRLQKRTGCNNRYIYIYRITTLFIISDKIS